MEGWGVSTLARRAPRLHIASADPTPMDRTAMLFCLTMFALPAAIIATAVFLAVITKKQSH